MGLTSGNLQPPLLKLLTALKGHILSLAAFIIFIKTTVRALKQEKTSSGRNQFFIKCEIVWSSDKSESCEGDSKYVKDKRKSANASFPTFLMAAKLDLHVLNMCQQR